MTTNARQTYKLISPADAKAKIDGGNAQVLDIRNANDYSGGHVPGALNLPFISVRTRGEAELDKEKELIFIDSDGQRAPQACEAAASIGFENLFVVDGGTEAWLKAGYETQTSDFLI